MAVTHGEIRAPRFFYGWVILGATFVTLFMATGLQYSFGVFFKPILNDFGWDRASLSLAVSINALLYGALQPVVGKMVDDRGPRRVIIVCATVMALGVAAISLTSDLWVIYISYGLITSAGYSGLTVVSTSALVMRWFVKRRGMALSVAGAGFAAGQLVMIPFSAYLIMLYGWRSSALILGALLACTILPLGIWVMKSGPEAMGFLPDGERPAAREGSGTTEQGLPGAGKVVEARLKTPIKVVARTSSFWLLAGGFFVCGFTANLVLTHLAPMTTDRGFSEFDAANALGIVGGAATLSALAIGILSDYTGRKNPLAGVYLLRGFSLLLLITVVNDITGLYIFALLFGLSRAATIPLTSGLAGDLYGRHSIGSIYGLILLAHQVGAAIGTYVGGALFDATGTYFWAFLIASILGFVAACASFLIRERRGALEPAKAVSN